MKNTITAFLMLLTLSAFAQAPRETKKQINVPMYEVIQEDMKFDSSGARTIRLAYFDFRGQMIFLDSVRTDILPDKAKPEGSLGFAGDGKTLSGTIILSYLGEDGRYLSSKAWPNDKKFITGLSQTRYYGAVTIPPQDNKKSKTKPKNKK